MPGWHALLTARESQAPLSSPPDRLSSVALVKPCAVWFRKRNQAIEVLEAGSVVQIAQKFERFLDTYRRSEGSRWGGQDLHDATAGVVSLSYLTSP